MPLRSAEYPQQEPWRAEEAPVTVQVTARYPGGDAKVVADTVAAPIEQQVNGVERMLYMSDLSGSSEPGGRTSRTVPQRTAEAYFEAAAPRGVGDPGGNTRRGTAAPLSR